MTISPELKQQLDDVIKNNKIVVFMKGTKLMPMCGFSNNVVQILNSLGATYETINVLDNEEIRQSIKEYSQWPTIPQVYIDGEFLGGSDIMIEMLQNGELEQKVAIALAS